MKRIILLVIRLFYRIPGLLLKIHYYNKHIDETSFEERFKYIQNKIKLINSKSRVTIHCFGKENLPQDQGYLMTPNHQGLFDALILLDTHDQPFKAVLKQELLNVPVLKNIISMLQYSAIDRQNLRTSMKVIKNASKEMKEGRSYVIFPEGTRCRKQNQMLEFKGGSFKAAIDVQKPIVPVALIDCYKVFDNNSIEKVDAQIHYLEPLYYEDYQDLSSTEIAQLIQEKIKKCIEEHEKDFLS